MQYLTASKGFIVVFLKNSLSIIETVGIMVQGPTGENSVFYKMGRNVACTNVFLVGWVFLSYRIFNRCFAGMSPLILNCIIQ
jgi:hypothetical protein